MRRRACMCAPGGRKVRGRDGGDGRRAARAPATAGAQGLRRHNYLGHNYTGLRCHNWIGYSYIGHDFRGHNHVGRRCYDDLSHNYLGHNYIYDGRRAARAPATAGAQGLRRHNYLGHNYTGLRCHNWIGHNYIGDQLYRP